ncbi:MAG: hypothetical protein K6L60_08630 [Oceanobacter sp.]
MGVERRFTITCTFPDTDQAKAAKSQLKAALKQHDHDLSQACHSIHSIDNIAAYQRDTINIESIKQTKDRLMFYGYTYTPEHVDWFMPSLASIGAHRIHYIATADGYKENNWYLHGKRVSKKTFDKDKPKKPLSPKDLEINSQLFLPEGRATVDVTVGSIRCLNEYEDMFGRTLVIFHKDDGHAILHIGNGKLIDMAEPLAKLRFDAAFERIKWEGEYYAKAMRPTKIQQGWGTKPRPTRKKAGFTLPAGIKRILSIKSELQQPEVLPSEDALLNETQLLDLLQQGPDQQTSPLVWVKVKQYGSIEEDTETRTWHLCITDDNKKLWLTLTGELFFKKGLSSSKVMNKIEARILREESITAVYGPIWLENDRMFMYPISLISENSETLVALI